MKPPHPNDSLSSMMEYFLDSPAALEPGCTNLELRETHLSAVLLSKTHAFKFKKAVDYGFVRQIHVTERLENCRRELALNSRTAPDVYLSVRFVHARNGGFRLSEAESGMLEPCVIMRRLAEEDSLLARVTSGRVRAEEVELVAAFIADFHAGCRRGPDITALHTFEKNQAENLEAIEQFLREDETRALAGQLAQAGDCARFLDLCNQIRAYSRERLGLVHERERRGAILDGHGDLRLDHIFIEQGRPLVIDCVEFNAGFRAVDPFEDLAFAGMGFRMEGRPDLGRTLELAYTARTTDVRGWNAAPLFEIYRACVRAKVDAIQCRAREDYLGTRAHVRFYGYMRLLLEIHGRDTRARTPMLFVVGGLPGTGKSTLAGRLSREHEAPVIATDLVRKALAGKKPEQDGSAPAFEGLYAPGKTRQTYARVLALAGVLLGRGRSVVLDGTFASRQARLALRRLAERTNAIFTFYEVTSPVEVIQERLRKRAAEGSVSDIRDFETWERLARRYEPPGEELGAALVRAEGFAPDAGV